MGGDKPSRPRMKVLTRDGLMVIKVRKAEDVSAVGRYWNGIKHFLDTGDDSQLWAFEGETVEGQEFQTDLDAIEEEARRGELGFEDIYEG